MSSPHSILCVDDDPTGLTVRKVLLERHGYHVVAELAPEVALERDAREFELALLDFYMPTMKGDELARELRRRNPGMSIIILSAFINLPESISEVADAVLIKGEPPEKMLTVIETLLHAPAK